MTQRRAKVGGKRSGAGRPALAPGEARSAVIRARVTPSELGDAMEIAKREDISISDFGREAIRLAIARGSTR